MATNMANAEATRLLDASLGKNAMVAPTTPMMLGLFTSTGSASSAGTEMTGGSYARQNLTTALPSGSTNGSITSNGAVTFTALPSGTVTSVEVYDSNGTPRRAWWGALTSSKTVGTGDSLTLSSGSIVISNNN